MSAEYSVGEVRARLVQLNAFVNGKCSNDEAGRKCLGFIFQYGQFLAERTEADERRLTDWREIVGSCRIEGPKEDVQHLLKIIRSENPPAQAAQVDTEGKEQWDELAAILGCDGDNVDLVFQTAKRIMSERIAPTAEPVAQGELTARVLYGRWAGQQDVHCNRIPAWQELSEQQRSAWMERATAPDTGDAEIDKAIGGLMSSDPTFDDCERAAADLRRLATHPHSPDAADSGRVTIDFGSIGSAGPFSIINGKVTLPDVTLVDLVHRMQPTLAAQGQGDRDALTVQRDEWGQRLHPLPFAGVPDVITDLEECRKVGWNDSAPAYRAGWNACRATMLDAAPSAPEGGEGGL